MSQIVRCEVCGGVYNQRYLRAHTRLSHRNTQTVTSPSKSELEALEVILSLYTQLSDKNKKTLRERLTNPSEGTP